MLQEFPGLSVAEDALAFWTSGPLDGGYAGRLGDGASPAASARWCHERLGHWRPVRTGITAPSRTLTRTSTAPGDISGYSYFIHHLPAQRGATRAIREQRSPIRPSYFRRQQTDLSVNGYGSGHRGSPPQLAHYQANYRRLDTRDQ